MSMHLWRFLTGDDRDAQGERAHDLRVDATIQSACAHLARHLETWDNPLAPDARAFLREFSRPSVTRGELDRAALTLLQADWR